MERLHPAGKALQEMKLTDRTKSAAEASSTESVHPVFRQERFRTGKFLDRSKPLTTYIEGLVNSRDNRQISWGEFMAASQFHEQWGYYTDKVRIAKEGKENDFYTLPEKTSAFGTTLGRYSYKIWEAMGEPDNFDSLEMGAGNASIAYPFLSWSERENTDFHEKIQYKIVEQSTRLTAIQKEKLSRFATDEKVEWAEGSAIDLKKLGIGNIRGVIFSNELPDAFAIERVTLLNDNIVQKYVTIENDEWVEVWGKPSREVSEYIKRNKYNIVEGREEPVNLGAERLIDSACLALEDGAIVTIDYGRRGQVGIDNEVAVRYFGRLNGKQIEEDNMFDIYDGIGEIDMTADVDFEPLERIAQKHGLEIAFSGLQEDFLRNNGFDEEVDRLEKLAETGDLDSALDSQGAFLTLEDRFKEFHVTVMISKGVDKNLL